jgi:hypothetical protein
VTCMSINDIKDADERRLAELGYKQELDRSWSSFSNFAISFSIFQSSRDVSQHSAKLGITVDQLRSRSVGQ